MPSKWVRDLQMKHHKEHMERINQMKPVVDNKKPRELPMSGKKEIERRRFREKVEKGNRLLLDRLGKALERKNIDNERKPIKFNSLEQGKKKLELARVTMENQLLLERIQLAQPMYDHHQWERDAEHREFYLKNMTEFPELYVPHYPPLKKKFIKEQQRMEEEKKRQAARRKARDNGEPYSDTVPSKSASPTNRSPAHKKGQLSPPKNEPFMGISRPIEDFELTTPHIVPTKPHQPSWKGVKPGEHPLEQGHLMTNANHETEFLDDKGERLLHGAHDQALYAGHHMKAVEPIQRAGYVEDLYLTEHVATSLPAPYQGADTHGLGPAGIVGNVSNVGLLEQAAKEAGMS
jgi:hypothetical protein